MKTALLIFALCLAASAQVRTNGSMVIDGSINACVTDTGTTNAFACNFSPAIGGYLAETRYCFNPASTNTGAATITFNSLGATTIRKWKAGLLVDLDASDIVASQRTCMIYDGAYMQLQGTASGVTALSAINPQTATYQVLASDFTAYKTIVISSGTFTITLVAAGSQPAAGTYTNIVNYGTGTITIVRSGQNINGGTGSISLAPASASATTGAKITSDGANYFAQTFGIPCTYDATNGLQCGTGPTVQTFIGATSGSQALTVDSIAGSGTWKLKPNASSDYLVGEALPAIFTGKTFDTAGSGNSLLINGLAATANTGTGNVVRATSPTISAPALSGSSTGSTILQAAATASGTVTLPAATDTLMGKATTDVMTGKTFDTAGSGNVSKIGGLTLPATAGTAGQRLQVNSGVTAYTNQGFAVTCTNHPSSTLSDTVTTKQTFNTSCAVPAGAFTAGVNLIMDVTFQITTVTSPSAITFSMQIDGTDVYATSSVAQSASFTNRQQFAHFFMGTEVALGSSVAVEVGGAMALSGFAQAQSNNLTAQPITLNTNNAHTITWSIQYAAANSNQSITLRRVAAYAAL